MTEMGEIFHANGYGASVKEHATLSARARVDHGVEVENTGEHVNRAADRGCCVSTCSVSLLNVIVNRLARIIFKLLWNI